MKQSSSASPKAIVMVGLPGSGKSAFAEHFAETFQAPIINSGALQQELRLDGDQADWLQAIVLNEYLKTRRTVLVDAPLETKARRAAVISTIIKAGYHPLLVWVQTDPVESRRRATKKYPVGSGLTPEEFQDAFRNFEPPTAKERPVVISGKHTFTTQLKVVLKQIATATERPASASDAPARNVKQPRQEKTPPAPTAPSTPSKPRGISIR